jgi:hypothetical protein
MSQRVSPTPDSIGTPEHGPVVTFLKSSQAQHWRYNAKQIEEMRRRGNEAASKRLEEAWRRERVSLAFECEERRSPGLI